MKINKLTNWGGYISPAVELIELAAQGVMCASIDKWHKTHDPNSNFSFEYDDEITWK